MGKAGAATGRTANHCAASRQRPQPAPKFRAPIAAIKDGPRRGLRGSSNVPAIIRDAAQHAEKTWPGTCAAAAHRLPWVDKRHTSTLFFRLWYPPQISKPSPNGVLFPPVSLQCRLPRAVQYACVAQAPRHGAVLALLESRIRSAGFARQCFAHGCRGQSAHTRWLKFQCASSMKKGPAAAGPWCTGRQRITSAAPRCR